MSKEELLIALLKSEQSPAELYKSKSNNAEIEETKKFFNELRNKFSKSKIKEKGLENRGQEKKKKHATELKNIKKSLENLKKYHDKDDQEYKGIST